MPPNPTRTMVISAPRTRPKTMPNKRSDTLRPKALTMLRTAQRTSDIATSTPTKINTQPASARIDGSATPEKIAELRQLRAKRLVAVRKALES